MPYQTSDASLAVIQKLRDLLGGGRSSSGGSSSSNPIADLLNSITTSQPSPSSAPSRQQSGTPFTDLLQSQYPVSKAFGVNPPAQPPVDYVEEFLKSMAGNIGGGAGGLNQADYEEALKNSAAQIKGAFGAEIGAVKASSANARHQTKRSKKQIKAMYNALGRQYDKSAALEVGQGKDIASALQGVATNASGQLKGTSDQLINEQAALAQGLGVQSALPDVTAAQRSNVASQVGDIQQYGARQAGDALSNSGSQQRFLVRGGRNALLEGTNRRADLVQQLQAFLQENMGKIADIKGQRGQALAANEMSAAKAFGDAAGQAQDSSWQHQKDLAGLLLSLRGQNADQSQQASQNQQKVDSNLLDWMKLLSSSAGQTKDPKTMAQILQYIQDAMKAQAGG